MQAQNSTLHLKLAKKVPFFFSLNHHPHQSVQFAHSLQNLPTGYHYLEIIVPAQGGRRLNSVVFEGKIYIPPAVEMFGVIGRDRRFKIVNQRPLTCTHPSSNCTPYTYQANPPHNNHSLYHYPQTPSHHQNHQHQEQGYQNNPYNYNQHNQQQQHSYHPNQQVPHHNQHQEHYYPPQNAPAQQPTQQYEPNHYAPPTYGPIAMSEQDFSNLKKIVKDEAFDDTRLKIVQQATSRQAISCQQLKQLLTLFSFESNKVTLAKNTYTNLVDPERFYLIYDGFRFSSSVDELTAFVEKQ